MAKYGKKTGIQCYWLTKNGKSLAKFDDEKEVDAIIEMEAECQDFSRWVDNTLNALEAGKASGLIINDDVLEIIELGMSGKPQHPETRLG